MYIYIHIYVSILDANRSKFVALLLLLLLLFRNCKYCYFTNSDCVDSFFLSNFPISLSRKHQISRSTDAMNVSSNLRPSRERNNSSSG